MKILIVGGNGTIGKKVVDHYNQNHEVIIAGRNSGDVSVDIADSDSIIPMNKVVKGYVRSVEGKGNGEVIRIYE